VTVTADRVTYRLVYGDEGLEIAHYGKLFSLTYEPVEHEIPAAPQVEPVHQPPHAAPRRRNRPTSD
jgi:alpha,alpha-trehalose phosphorylase